MPYVAAAILGHAVMPYVDGQMGPAATGRQPMVGRAKCLHYNYTITQFSPALRVVAPANF